MKDRHDKPLKKGDPVKYVGQPIKTMQADPRPDVSAGDEGTVDGDYSSLLISVQFDKGGAPIETNRHAIEKLEP